MKCVTDLGLNEVNTPKISMVGMASMSLWFCDYFGVLCFR